MGLVTTTSQCGHLCRRLSPTVSYAVSDCLDLQPPTLFDSCLRGYHAHKYRKTYTSSSSWLQLPECRWTKSRRDHYSRLTGSKNVGMVQSLSTCVSPVASPDGQQLSASALPRVLGKAQRLQSQSLSHSSAGLAAQTLPICGCCGPAHTTGTMVSATESGAPAGCQPGPHQHVPQWGL